MGQPAFKLLHELQWNLYQRAFGEAKALEGSARKMKRYDAEYHASLPSEFQLIDHTTLAGSLATSDIILFGDFHSHKQSQRGLLRLLRDTPTLAGNPERPIVLAFEMFKKTDQKFLDLYIAGKLSEKKLLEATNYQDNWGFPWEHYLPLIRLAREKNIRLVGVSPETGGKGKIEERDLFAAEVILSELVAAQHHARVICLIGEYHLATKFLPEQLVRSSKEFMQHVPVVTRIFCNVDKYYFLLNPSKARRSSEYLRLGPHSFCIINSTPWIKWQSHALWMEAFLSDTVDDFAYLAEDGDDIDLDYHLHCICRDLETFLNMPNFKEEILTFTIRRLVNEEDLKLVTPRQLKTIAREHLEEVGFFVHKNSRQVWIPTVSINNLTEAAGQLLFCVGAHLQENPTDKVLTFTQSCLKTCFGVLAAKLLNPKKFVRSDARKLDNPPETDEELLVMAKLMRALAAPVSDTINLQGILQAELPKESDRLARQLGEIIGARLYASFLRDQLSAAQLGGWITSPVTDIKEGLSTLTAIYHHCLAVQQTV